MPKVTVPNLIDCLADELGDGTFCSVIGGVILE